VLLVFIAPVWRSRTRYGERPARITGNEVFTIFQLKWHPSLVVTLFRPSASLNMTLEDRIRRLAENIVASRDEAQTVLLVRELQTLLYEHIKRLRRKLVNPSEFDEAA